MAEVTFATPTDPIFLRYVPEFQNHVEKFHYLISFLDTSSKEPSLIGMISWDALREGLSAEKNYFIEQKEDYSLSLKERDLVSNILSQIEIALERIAL